MNPFVEERWELIVGALSADERPHARFVYVEGDDDYRVPGVLLENRATAYTFKVAERRLGLLSESE